jgi:hypothetical protein
MKNMNPVDQAVADISLDTLLQLTAALRIGIMIETGE